MPAWVQQALDWLGGTPAAAPPAPMPVSAPTPTPTSAALPGAAGRTRRSVRLGAVAVPYVLTRARRRSIGFSVGPDGLAVRAPSWVTLAAIDAALQDKADWIVRKLAEQQARAQQIEGARIAWADGATLPYLGGTLTLRLDPELRHARHGATLVPGAGGAYHLHVPLARHASAAQLRDTVQAWLMRQARSHFAARLDHYAPQLGVRWTRLALSGARTRWGSARADGSIRLNWRLMHYGSAIIDYVVVHELSHLRVMDHSPQFWGTVGSVLPDYQQRRRQLHEQPAPPWDY